VPVTVQSPHPGAEKEPSRVPSGASLAWTFSSSRGGPALLVDGEPGVAQNDLGERVILGRGARKFGKQVAAGIEAQGEMGAVQGEMAGRMAAQGAPGGEVGGGCVDGEEGIVFGAEGDLGGRSWAPARAMEADPTRAGVEKSFLEFLGKPGERRKKRKGRRGRPRRQPAPARAGPRGAHGSRPKPLHSRPPGEREPFLTLPHAPTGWQEKNREVYPDSRFAGECSDT